MFTFLPSRLSDCLCGLTFHTEFGATAVFVDENEKDEEEDTSEACQAHSDGNLGEMKRCVRLRQRSDDGVHIISSSMMCSS